ncbi:MAG: hypothetical protein K6C05_10330 [Anaerovibrio sp.]|nr:hypothetical protein [Anaerovibrio sp.]
MKYGKIAISALVATSLACTYWYNPVGIFQQDMGMKVAQANKFAQIPDKVYESNGLKLTIPYNYDDLLYIDTVSESPGGLFSVSEKASREAAKKGYNSFDGAGWLFSIGKVPEKELHEYLCNDMSGREYFAKDGKGNCYIYYHPTDVRYFRDTPAAMERDQEQWSVLNRWAWSIVRNKFVEDNGLIPQWADNSNIGIYLANVMYGDGMEYSISKRRGNPVNGSGFSALPYARRMLYNARYDLVNGEVNPTGDYISLTIPKYDVRLDFFTGDKNENLVREIRKGETVGFYRASFLEHDIECGDILDDWEESLRAHKDMERLGYTPESLLGTWAEKIAGRCTLEIKKGSNSGVYNIQISWGNGAMQSYVWTMTAIPASCHSLWYTDGCLRIHTVNDLGLESEVVKYKDGTGLFILNSAHEIMWEDYKEDAGDDLVFASTT